MGSQAKLGVFSIKLVIFDRVPEEGIADSGVQVAPDVGVVVADLRVSSILSRVAQVHVEGKVRDL